MATGGEAIPIVHLDESPRRQENRQFNLISWGLYTSTKPSAVVDWQAMDGLLLT